MCSLLAVVRKDVAGKVEYEHEDHHPRLARPPLEHGDESGQDIFGPREIPCATTFSFSVFLVDLGQLFLLILDCAVVYLHITVTSIEKEYNKLIN